MVLVMTKKAKLQTVPDADRERFKGTCKFLFARRYDTADIARMYKVPEATVYNLINS